MRITDLFFRFFFPATVLFAVLPARAQQSAPPAKSEYEEQLNHAAPPAYSTELTAQLTTLRDAALSDDYAYQQVKYLTENIGARPEGSAQAQAAVDYVADQLRKLGLDVHLEPVMVPRWTRGQDTAELVEYPGHTYGTSQRIVLLALSGNAPTSPEGITANVVVVNDFQELEKLGREKVSGRIVLYNVHFDRAKAANGLADDAYDEAVLYRGLGAKRAQDLGAVGSLVRSVGNADYRIPHAGWSAPADIPAGAVTSEDANLIADLAAEGPVRMHLVLTSRTSAPVQTYNVVGDIKGSEHPEQVVVVSGHLDSWDPGTGAIDDAAGVGVAMETAQLVQQLHMHPKRTLRVIAWMDEENGGTGHNAYTKAHAGDFANYAGAIESDLGADHPLGFLAKISPRALPLLQPVQDILGKFGANLIKMNDDTGADIEPMSKAGVPAFGIMQDARTYFNYHHTAADTLDKITPRLLQENAAAMAVMGFALADMPNLLPR
jgi:Iap family predicted aminopeptidase